MGQQRGPESDDNHIYIIGLRACCCMHHIIYTMILWINISRDDANDCNWVMCRLLSAAVVLLGGIYIVGNTYYNNAVLYIYYIYNYIYRSSGLNAGNSQLPASYVGPSHK
jgi:hypothetical protein